MGFEIEDLNSGFRAGVDVLKRLRVFLAGEPEDAGYARILDSNGDPVLTTENGAISVSQDAILFREQVDGSVLNTNLWLTSVSGLTITQASGFINVNGAAATTVNAYAILQSLKYFSMYSYLPLRVTFNAATPNIPQVNAAMELGIGLVATNAAPTDGCFFRWNSSAEFRCVINYGGVETQSAALPPPPQNDSTLFEIVIVEDVVQFYIDDVLVVEIEVPAGYAFPTSNGRLPLFARVYNGGSVPSAPPVLWIGQVIVVLEGAVLNRAHSEFLASVGGGGYQLPVSPFTQTHQWANSAQPSAATLSNTIAGYAAKGGKFGFASVAGAETDYLLFAWQNTTGYQEFIYGVKIDIAVGVLLGVGPSLLEWAIGVNASAASLATAESPPTTWSHKRIPLGQQALAALAVAGVAAQSISVQFQSPLIVDSGRYGSIILRIPVGTATGSLRGLVTILDVLE